MIAMQQLPELRRRVAQLESSLKLLAKSLESRDAEVNSPGPTQTPVS